MNSMNDQFVRSLAKILSIPSDDVEPGIELNENNWDSMTMISAIALIDETFGVTVPVEKLASCATVGDLVTLVYSISPANPEGVR
jgi:acyl carrier protein